MKENYEIKHLEKFMPYPFIDNGNGEQDNQVYGQIYLEEISYFADKEGVRVRISASLSNEVMIAMEYEAIEFETNNKYEAPLFFYEFEGEATFEDKAELAKYILLYGGIDTYYKFRIIDMGAPDIDIELIREKYKVLFSGQITFSASPILTHKVSIVVDRMQDEKDKNALKMLQAVYDNWDKTIKNKCVYDKIEIQKKLDDLFGNNLVSRNVSIYNVGQANCCYCDFDTKKIFFDIGVTRSSVDRQSTLVSKAINEISKLDVDAVVLSHWDLDHILGVCYNQKCLYDKIWIVPDFEKLYSSPRASIKRLCNYLLKNGKSELLMIDTTDVDKELFVSSNSSVAIYMGTPKAAHGINKMNNGGLIMKLQNRRNILLPGDCENTIIPLNVAGVEYDIVVVPHHGSIMSDPKVKGKTGKRNIAYICCGNVTGNCIMDSEIVDKYNANGFDTVHRTKNLKRESKFKIRL